MAATVIASTKICGAIATTPVTGCALAWISAIEAPSE
jgi:hypothetical protein